MKETRYPIAKDGIFLTVQGEGVLLGLPMVFVRLAGCSVGCPQCDTDYRVDRRMNAKEIGQEVSALLNSSVEWIWITGGEPADHDISELVNTLKHIGKIALATSGTKILPKGLPIDFVSVSPHSTPKELVLTHAEQVNLVPGLNGLKLSDWERFDFSNFGSRFVTPVDDPVNDRLAECIGFACRNSGWRVGVQAHKKWGIA